MRTEKEIRARVSFLKNLQETGMIEGRLLTVSEHMDFCKELDILEWVLGNEGSDD